MTGTEFEFAHKQLTMCYLQKQTNALRILTNDNLCLNIIVFLSNIDNIGIAKKQ